MNGKNSLLTIILVFALPILLYMVVKAPKEHLSNAAMAEASGKPKVLQFSQQMCSECNELEGIFAPIKSEYKDKIIFVKINVADGTPETGALMKKYSVRVVPTLVFMRKDGTIFKVTEGAMPAGQLKGYLDSIIK